MHVFVYIIWIGFPYYCPTSGGCPIVITVRLSIRLSAKTLVITFDWLVQGLSYFTCVFLHLIPMTFTFWCLTLEFETFGGALWLSLLVSFLPALLKGTISLAWISPSVRVSVVLNQFSRLILKTFIWNLI
jgi:hypothetical protein